MIPSIRAPRSSSWSARVRHRADHQVDEAGDLGPLADRDVERQHLVAERRPGRREDAVVVGARLVELGDHHRAGHAHRGTLAPQRGGRVVDRLAGRDHEQCAVGGAEPGPDLAHEVGVPGCVDEVDLRVAMDDGGDGQGDGALVRPLGLLEVADRRAFLDRARAGDGSGGGEQRLDQGGLARAARPDEHHVADPVGAARPEILPGCSTTARLVRHGLPPATGAARAGPPTQNTLVLNQLLRRQMFKRRMVPESCAGRRRTAGLRGGTCTSTQDGKWGEPLAAWGQRGAHASVGC